MKFKLFVKEKFVGYELHELNPNTGYISIMYSLDNVLWSSLKILHDVKRSYIGRVDSKGVEIFDNDRVSYETCDLEGELYRLDDYIVYQDYNLSYGLRDDINFELTEDGIDFNELLVIGDK